MMQSPKKDMAGVISFYPSERPDLIEQLDKLQFNDNDPLNTNYKNIDWHEFQVISVYENDGIVQGFSVAWHRPEYYAENEVRILSRYWKDTSIRLTCTHIELSMPHLIDMITHQMTMCKEVGFTDAFISREKSPRYFRKLITSIQEKTGTDWHLYDDKQCVCVPEAPSCWQYKASTKL